MLVKPRFLIIVFTALLITGLGSQSQAVPTQAPITGEIQRITLNSPTDHWSGGTIVVGGQTVIIPRNLLLDLPANRLTLKQLFDQAPAGCTGQTGLAKADPCNTTGVGGFATISANRTIAGNTIAGDVFIEKGKEAVIGAVTYINYTEGYFRVNGTPAAPGGNTDPGTGVMVRLNDPTGRHTVQSGLGCTPGSASVNCSPDPRFTLDPDNYTHVFSSGYPLCIPKTADGLGDPFCPRTNRAPVFQPFVAEPPVPDSTRFAPIVVGDSLTAEGNFEMINGVQFLSTHTIMVHKALTTQANQPDYLFLDEVEIDAPGFQNQRARTLIIGYATQAAPIVGADILIWSIHRDPVNNAVHEFPLASVRGCDSAAGAGTCGVQGLGGAGNNIFKIRHDVDFTIATDAKLDPCAHLRADPRFAGLNICPGSNGTGTNIAEQFAILSPIPHEIQARTGQKLATPGFVVLDVQGNPATWGQYLFPFGMNLGGVSTPEMNEINLDLLATPFIFEGISWNLDRRLSPGGCNGPCDATPQPLDPFPFSGLDPRTQASIPNVSYNDPNYTASPLTSARDRILSYVDAEIGKFNGNATVLPLSLAVDPAVIPIVPVTPVTLVCTATGTNTPPLAADDTATTPQNTAVVIDVLINDSDPDVGGTLNATTVTVVNAPANGTTLVDAASGAVTYTPNAAFVGLDSFTYTVQDNLGAVSNVAIVRVTVTPIAGNTPPVAVDDTATTLQNTAAVVDALLNDTGADGTLNPASVIVMNQPTNGTTSVNTTTGAITYTPNAPFTGLESFTYTVRDNLGAVSNVAIVRVTVTPIGGDTPPVAVNDTATTLQNNAVISDVLANDTDADGTLNPASVTVVNQPANGTTSVNTTTGAITYTPNAGFAGSDSFTYTVQDNLGAVSNVAIVRVTVSLPPNTPPAAVDDTATTLQNNAVIIGVLANDTDVDGTLNPASVTVANQPANGVTSVNTATGAITYTPNAGFAGSDSFTYTVQDNLGAVSNVAIVRVSVVGVPANIPPIATNDVASTPQGIPVLVNVLANDSDPDGTLNPATLTAVSLPANGTLFMNTATGTITYTPRAGFSGADTFTYTVADNLGAVSNVATAVITVQAPSFEALAILRAEFVAGAGWRIAGSSTANGATVTIHLGSNLGGPVIGTAAVAGNKWEFRGLSTAVPDPGTVRTISVESTGGGVVLGAPLSVR